MIDELKEYINNQIALAKLEAVDKSSNIFAGLIYFFILVSVLVVVFFLLVIVLGFWLSSIFESYVKGFLSACGIFFLLFILVIIFKKALQSGFKNLFIRKAFQSENKKLDYD